MISKVPQHAEVVEPGQRGLDTYVVHATVLCSKRVQGGHVGRRRRLSFTAFSVLYAMENGHSYGFDIMDTTGLASGTVYPVLSRLQRDGLVESSWEDEAPATEEGRPARRYYELTPDGSRALSEALTMLKGIGGDRLVQPRPAEGPSS